MLSIVELKTATLDYGIPGVSPIYMLLLFLMMLAIPMIPYLFLYLSLGGDKGSASPIVQPATNARRKIFAWVHPHRHPDLLHH